MLLNIDGSASTCTNKVQNQFLIDKLSKVTVRAVALTQADVLSKK